MKVKEGKIKDIDEILESGKRILEYQIIDLLIPNLQAELITIGQAKGKFGGGKRRFWRQTQRKTAEGNVPSFACMAVIGDGRGHVGIGVGKARETLPAKEKAARKAKLSIIRVERGCGSFDCSCSDPHSIPFKTESKVGSSVMRLMPASKGTGLVIDNECKKVMIAAGIKDVYSRTFGQTRTKINLIKACFEALRKISEVKR
jgi:small subunit ribosomal protein S5